MTIFLISTGIDRAKEDSLDVQHLLVFSFFSPFLLSELRDNSRQMLLIFFRFFLKQTRHFSYGCIGREHSSHFAMKQAIYNSIKSLLFLACVTDFAGIVGTFCFGKFCIDSLALVNCLFTSSLNFLQDISLCRFFRFSTRRSPVYHTVSCRSRICLSCIGACESPKLTSK